MTEKNWRERVIPPTTEEIHAKITERLKFFEDALREKGLHLVLGAEQEFFVLNENKRRFPILPKHSDKYLLVKRLEKDIPLLDYLHEEGLGGEYEIVLGTRGKSLSTPYASVELADQIYTLRKVLPAYTSDIYEGSSVSFSPTGAYPVYDIFRYRSTAGLHTSLSVSDTRGNNLFYDKHRTDSECFSRLADDYAHRLLALQKEGLILYAPQEQSLKRYGKHCTPSAFSIGTETKEKVSISKRATLHHKDGKRPQYFRLEDRLAGADANPYLILLANMGALYSAVCDQEKGKQPNDHDGMPDKKISKDINDARHSFKRSMRWRAIAGEDLYADLVAYFCTQTQGREAAP